MSGKPRTLVIDGVDYRWARSHGHVEIEGERRCVERFAAWEEGARGACLRVRFLDGAGGCSTAGGGWGGHDGGLLVDGVAFNLHRPAVAAAIIRAGRAEGWRGGSGEALAIKDGYALLRGIGPISEPREA